MPDMVNKAYGDNTLAFGRTYLIPKPLDPRLITTIIAGRGARGDGKRRRLVSPSQTGAPTKTSSAARLGVNQKLMNRITSAAPLQPEAAWCLPEADNV
ncbi:MAG: hypothetical protein WKG07_14985 [Hymenobacter sp.]